MAVVAMFPLGTVLLPGGVLPLQIFEPRYRVMIHDLLSDAVDAPEFGVVLIERGHEVGGGDQRTEVGTLARIADIAALPDGRFALVAIGRDRFRINAWIPDDPYPLADVELWPDTVLDGAELGAARQQVAALHARVRGLNEQVRSLGQMVPPPDDEVSDDPIEALYQLGSLAPLGPVDRQRLLTAGGFWERAAVFADALDDAEAVVRFRSS